MNEESLNIQIRKFLKKTGIASQRDIETAVRDGVAGGKLRVGDEVALKMTLVIESLGVSRVVEGGITIE